MSQLARKAGLLALDPNIFVSTIVPMLRVKSLAHLSLLAFMIVGYLLATAYPFELVGENHAELRPDSARFSESGVLRSRGGPPWVADAIENDELSIDLTVRPYFADQRGPARILTLSRDPYARNLTIGQQRHDLIVRLRRGDFTPNGMPEFAAGDVFVDRGIKKINVAIRDGTLEVRVDGRIVIEDLLPPKPLAHWSRAFPVALGNEVTSDRPWLGEITSAQITTPSQRIDLLAPGTLYAPKISKSFSLAPTLSDYRDVLINIGGFMLFGMLSLTCLVRPSPIWTGAIWAPVSLIGETQQLFINGRHPSLTDFVLNAGGALIGAYLALYIARELRSA